MWAEHQFARQRAGLVGRRDANKDVVGKGRRHCQRSSSSRESPVFVGAAESASWPLIVSVIVTSTISGI
jgi:hypothetical protein